MAIPGKFEENRDVFCPTCGMTLVIAARSIEWSGDLRTSLFCTTPGCGKIFEDERKRNRSNKGNISWRQQIPLFSLNIGDEVVLEDYDCSERDAERFCSIFRDVLKRIPICAHDALLAHWQTGKGSPHVWLLEDRKEWNGVGWAASRTQGLSLCIVSTLIGLMPDEFLGAVIAHELCHTLFIAGGESYHCQSRPNGNPFMQSPVSDPLCKYRQEWLVWRLMEFWGFDQPSMEMWFERNVIDDENGIRASETPRTDVEFECLKKREEIETKLKDMVFPSEFQKYRGN